MRMDTTWKFQLQPVWASLLATSQNDKPPMTFKDSKMEDKYCRF